MITTWNLPNPSDPDVAKLTAMHGLLGTPDFVPYSALGYTSNFCHISAKHHAMTNGGKRVHGWSYWRMTDTDPVTGNTASLMTAEHHSVWQNPDGTLIDVTPPKHRASQTLFLIDATKHIPDLKGEILIRNGLMELAPDAFLQGVDIVSHKGFILDEANTKAAFAYASRIGFDMDLYPTDNMHG